jgi:deazaflavin-dependent oxidoreductase (nitroreductase family)
MLLPDALVTFIDRVTQRIYRFTDGRLGGKQLTYSMLLLHTTGRKSGQKRTHTLLYVRDGEDMIVCASNNGQAHHPAWYWNLKANPRAQVQAGRQHYEVIAEIATGEQYQRLWQKLVAVRPQYIEYRTRTTREFPIVILKPVDAPVPTS